MDLANLNWDVQEQPEEGLNFYPTPESTPKPPQVVAEQATKLHYAMGEESPGFDELQKSLSTPEAEGVLRKTLADEDRKRLSDLKQKMVSDVAQQKGGTLTPEQIRYLRDFILYQPESDPDTILEKKFANKYTQDSLTNNPEGILSKESGNVHPGSLNQAMDTLYDANALTSYVQKKQQELYTNRGYGQAVLEFGESLIPGRNTAKLYWWDQGGTPAENLHRRIVQIGSLPLAQAKILIDQDLQDLQSGLLGGTDLALQYLSAFQGVPRQEQLLHNFQSILDAGAVGSVGLSASRKLAGLFGASARALTRSPTVAENIAEDMGDFTKAANIGAVKTLRGTLSGADTTLAANDLINNLPLHIRPSAVMDSDSLRGLAPNLSNEAKLRTIAALERSARNTPEIVTAIRNERLPPEALNAAISEAKSEFRLQYPSTADRIIQVSPEYNPVTNTHHISVRIGTEDGTLFRTESKANQAAQEMGLNVERYSVGKQRIPEGVNFAGEDILSFKTKQNVYKVHDDGASTTRPKGERSVRTVYVTPGNLKELLNVKGATSVRYSIDAEGRISSMARSHEVPWQIVGEVRSQSYPDKGLVPIELFGKTKRLRARDTYGKYHIGSEITELKTKTKETQRLIQQGDGWYIQVTKPVSEISDAVRNNLTISTENQNPVSLGNIFLGYLRGGRDVVAPFQMDNRVIATTVPQEIRRLIEDSAKDLKLRKDSREALENVLKRDQDYRDLATGETGRRFTSQAQLEQEWLQVNGELPSEKESLAYWTYYQIEEINFVLRNLNAYRDISRLGVELWNLPKFKGGETSGRTPNFFGKFVQKPDWESQEDFSIYIHEGPSGKLYYKSEAAGLRESVEHKIKEEGYRLVQIPNPKDRPLKELLGEGRTINYILSKDFESSPLPLKLVDKGKGVEVRYPHPFQVVQPRIARTDKGRNEYFGDQVAVNTHKLSDAEGIASKLNEVGRMIRSNVPYERIITYLETHLHGDPDMWLQEFAEGGRLNPETPFVASKVRVSSLDADSELRARYSGKERLIDHEKSGLNLFRNVDTSLINQARDSFNLEGKRIPSGDTPIYQLDTAEKLNPFSALQKSVSYAIRGMHIDDIKTSAIEQWAQQYKGLSLDPNKPMDNPLFFFQHADELLDKQTLNKPLLASARATRSRILQFIGQQDELTRATNYVEARIMDKLPHGFVQWMNVHEFPLISNPQRLLRNMMFHSYFGMFNPVQYWVQLQGAAHTVFVAGPRTGLSALTASVLQRMGLQFVDNPEFISHYARIASKFGWKPEWFTESYQLLKQSGFMNVGGEYAAVSDLKGPSLTKNFITKTLDAGGAFFREGERMTRMNAFNAAYLEFRKANPTKVLSREDIRKINSRAHTFNNNMTRANNGYLEEGIISPIFQFSTWQRRLIDQMWGSELTGAEKARALIGHSILYGLPMGIGIAVPLPFYDTWRKDALQNGVELSDKLPRFLMDGVLGTAASWIAGEDYDFSRRYGPSNTSFVYDWLYKDKTLLETFLGPSGSFLNSALNAAYPLRAFLGGAFMSGEEHLGVGDLISNLAEAGLDITRSISSVNSLFKAYYMINYGRYVSKNERILSFDANATDAAMNFFFGVNRQEFYDAQLMIGRGRDIKDAQQFIQKYAIKEINRGLISLSNGDYANWERHVKNAKIYMKVLGGFTPSMIADTWHKGFDVQSGTLEKARQNFLLKGGNISDLEARQNLFFNQK